MFIQYFTFGGTCVGAVKISLAKSTGRFVMTGENKQDILNKAFTELKLKISEQKKENKKNCQDVLSPYLFT